MAKLGIGIIGGGYMGKRHAAAFAAVGAVFETRLRPVLQSVAASSPQSAARYAQAYGFAEAADDWRGVIDNPAVDAVINAAPQSTHEEICVAALKAGKHVLCEKPLSVSVASGERMVAAARASGKVAMTGFNYLRTPASQFAKKLIDDGVLGQITTLRAEHTEDFYADPNLPATWRAIGRENGAMGDLAPHILMAVQSMMGPVAEVMADIETVHKARQGEPVENDDQASLMLRFENGVLGQVFVSRVATGRKMGLIYEVTGTKGALRFNQEDQNSLWLYDAADEPARQGFRQILAGPVHPDYAPFCDGPGHGTGYGDQIVIQAKAFLDAIEGTGPQWPSFEDGLMTDRIVDAAFASHEQRGWQRI